MTFFTERPSGTFSRDQSETGFTAILRKLVDATPGAIGAALVDSEGEAVDYAGENVDPFDLKVAAAHWRIILADIERGPLGARGGAPRRLVVRTDRRGYVVDALAEGYALLAILHHRAAFGHADRALDVAMRELYAEAGWAAPPDRFLWHPATVELSSPSSNARPTAVKTGSGFTKVEVIGKVVAGLQQGEVGFRVAAERDGAEVTLVRGRDGNWYADLPPNELTTSPRSKR